MTLFAAVRPALPAALLTAGVLAAAPPEDALRKRAVAGETSAQLELAAEFFFGKNRAANPALAAYWYRRAAQGGAPEGDYNLGVCCEHGWGVPKSPQRAFRSYTRAAEKGYAPALCRRALLLYTGIPAEDWSDERFPKLEAKREEALSELRAAAANYAPAKLALALKLHGDADARGAHAAEIGELARAAAESPEAGEEALLFYSECLRRGIGMAADPRRAALILERAGRQGSAAALARLGNMLEFGLGVPPDPDRALKLYREAAERGDPAARTRLGDHYLSGDMLPADPPRAAELYRQAADRRHPPAFAKLGDCLAEGWGVPANSEAAFAAYETGARLGDPVAQYKLARCHATGTGTPVDPAAAVFWYKCAGASGNRDAVRELGVAMLTGKGAPADPAEGRRLLEAAAKAGDRKAAMELEKAGRW